jgi:hypothetical protein
MRLMSHDYVMKKAVEQCRAIKLRHFLIFESEVLFYSISCVGTEEVVQLKLQEAA